MVPFASGGLGSSVRLSSAGRGSGSSGPESVARSSVPRRKGWSSLGSVFLLASFGWTLGTAGASAMPSSSAPGSMPSVMLLESPRVDPMELLAETPTVAALSPSETTPSETTPSETTPSETTPSEMEPTSVPGSASPSPAVSETPTDVASPVPSEPAEGDVLAAVQAERVQESLVFLCTVSGLGLVLVAFHVGRGLVR